MRTPPLFPLKGSKEKERRKSAQSSVFMRVHALMSTRDSVCVQEMDIIHFTDNLPLC